jgi:hypothetical protein
MAAAQGNISAATLDPALLAALKAATPEQVGDDLVLRLADGRRFYIDGFFAADEIGDGLPPVPSAIPLARDIADLLLGSNEADIETAAGAQEPDSPPPSGSTGFQSFAATPTPEKIATRETTAGTDALEKLDEEEARLGQRRNSTITETANDADGATGFQPLNLSAIGTISLTAGAAGAPSWSKLFHIRRLFALEELADSATDGWFDGLTMAHPLSDPLDLATFTVRFDPRNSYPTIELQRTYDEYLAAHQSLVAFADGRWIWANLSPQDGDHDNGAVNPGANLPRDAAYIFRNDDLIFGSSKGVDRLYGFAGNDILISFHGENHLYGGTGNDLLSFVQGSPIVTADGGEGDDTLLLVIQNEAFPVFAKDLGSIDSIERLVLLPEDPNNPIFLNEDNGSGRIVTGNFVFDLDAATILDWGGSLTIDCDVADIRLSDVNIWTRLPLDPTDPNYIHYVAESAGQTVTLAILASADQPIADVVVGTSRDDDFFLGDRIFGLIDGGAGNDQIFGGLMGGALGSFDLSDADLARFRNIENIVLGASGDHLTLSAVGVASITDSRNTLWITSAALRSDAAIGQVTLADPASWTALGYLSVETDALFKETRTGQVYGATINGENIYLFVQLGMQQPLAGGATNMDHWYVSHGANVALPPPGTMSETAVVDLTNAHENYFILDVVALADLAGADGSVSVIGDSRLDVVEFSDTAHWTFSHSDGAFNIYLGNNNSGTTVELRIASDLDQPYLLPDPTAGDLDSIDLSNGHKNVLTLDAEMAIRLAGPDQRLSLYGDATQDSLALADPVHWRLMGREDVFLVYEADDGAGHTMQLRLHGNVQDPLLQPLGTDGDDRLYAVSVNFLDAVDGKNGFDILTYLDGGQLILVSNFVKNVEAIDLHNGFDNQISFGAETLVSNGIGSPLFVTGEATDMVKIGDPARWVDTNVTISNPAISSHDFHVYQASFQTAGGMVVKELAIDVTLVQPDLV